MIVAGTYLDDNELIALAGRLRGEGLREWADRLEGAYYRDVRILEMSDEESSDLLSALGECPGELIRLRSALRASLATVAVASNAFDRPSPLR